MSTNQYTATGKLISKSATQQVTDKFRKREFVIEITDGQYPQPVQFQLTQDKCELLENATKDSEITVHFNLRGRAWNDPKTNTIKYFNTLDAWRVEFVDKGSIAETAPVTATDLPF